jgi:hypothetical protein
MTNLKKTLQKPANPPSSFVPFGLGLVTPYGIKRQVRKQFTVAGQRLEARRQGVDILWLDQVTGPAIVDDLARRAGRGSDGRQAERHPFQIDDSEAFVRGGNHQHVSLP